LEWSLKTFLAPWSYVASIVYHDSFWYAFRARGAMQAALDSEWGRLFQNWEQLTPDANGFPSVLATCLREAPELEARRRRAHRARA
jgi:hypothetical protein